MSNQKIISKIKEILGEVKQMALCTCEQNKPWCATVFFSIDDELNIYFFSRESRRHSKQVAKNKNVSGVVAREHKLDFDESHRGIQFEGVCQLVSKGESKKAYEFYKNRFPKVSNVHSMEDSTKELYKIKVNNFVLFDTLNFPDNPRQEMKWQ